MLGITAASSIRHSLFEAVMADAPEQHGIPRDVPQKVCSTRNLFKEEQTAPPQSVVFERRKFTSSCLAALFGVSGLLTLVIQNELVIHGASPYSGGVFALKLLNSIATAVCFFFIFNIHWYSELSSRLKRHAKEGYDFTEKGVTNTIFRSFRFWGEIFVCGVHLPPGNPGALDVTT